jgi:hypothetical protein
LRAECGSFGMNSLLHERRKMGRLERRPSSEYVVGQQRVTQPTLKYEAKSRSRCGLAPTKFPGADGSGLIDPPLVKRPDGASECSNTEVAGFKGPRKAAAVSKTSR